MTAADHPEGDCLRLAKALAFQAENNLETAAELYEKLLQDDPRCFPALLGLGKLFLERKELEAAATLLQRALMLNPRSVAAHLSLGLVERELQETESALRHFAFALRLAPNDPQLLSLNATALQELELPEAALEHWDRVCALTPDDGTAHLLRGEVRQDLKQPSAAGEDFRRALQLNPDLKAPMLGRAVRLDEAGRLPEALGLMELVLSAAPDFMDAYLVKCECLKRQGRVWEALATLDVALERQPAHLDILISRSSLLVEMARPDEALQLCEAGLQQHPDAEGLLMNRASALIALKRSAEAVVGLKAALSRRPDLQSLHKNLATALHRLGRHEEAFVSYERALAFNPGDVLTHANKIFLLDYLTRIDFEAHQAERRAYVKQHLQTQSVFPDFSSRNRNPDRPLVLGYVSADFKNHATASCFLPILEHHDRTQFQIICYSGVLAEDDWTRRCRQAADLWRDVAGLPDAALIQQIQTDEVDILIDLSGYTAGNRIPVFARKPAPIQVTAWGAGGGTGLPAIDYLFTDPVAIPEIYRPLLAETCVDLPCHLHFEAPKFAPAITPPPHLARGQFTLGCLNGYLKVSQEAERLWAEILHQLPGSRLLLKDGLFDQPDFREAVQQRFSQLGVTPERLDIRGGSSRQAHLATYGDIDLALDPFPMNGGVTTWEALWMGVPVVTKLGNTQASRVAGGIMFALGLGDWVARDETGYVHQALAWARDPQGLGVFRQSIRDRIRACPAGNSKSYTFAVERAYQIMWQRWLKQNPR